MYAWNLYSYISCAKNSYEDSVKRLDRFEDKLTLAAPTASVIPSEVSSRGGPALGGEGSRANARRAAPQKLEAGGSGLLP